MERTYARNRLRPLVGCAVALPLSLAVLGFSLWSLTHPAWFERHVAIAIHEGRALLAQPLGLIVAPAGLAIAFVQLARALDRRPLLVLSERGVAYRGWRVGTVAWRDVRDCRIVEVEEHSGTPAWARRRHLQFDVAGASGYLARAHGAATFSEAYGRAYFRVPLHEIAADADEVLQAVRAGIDAARRAT